MKHLIYILFLFSSIISGQTITLTELKASPDIEGFGRNTSGGRGGTVIYVTNLNNSGAGSLREAMLTSGSRIILFKVSGTINITSTINVVSDNMSIHGESAPGQGVQIIYGTGAWIEIKASNILIRNLRFRGASSTSQSMLRFITNSGKNLSNVVVDHCSFSWANPSEMGLDFEATGDPGSSYQWSKATVSNCIFGEMNRGILQFKGHYDISYYRNYFYGIYQRAPHPNRADHQPANVLGFEVINQIWHNMFHFPVEATFGYRTTVIGNKRRNVSGTANASGTQLIELNNDTEDGVEANTYLYQYDNLNEIGALYDTQTGSFIKPTPYYRSNIEGGLILPVANIDNMLPTLGAFYWNRDSHDQRFINYYLNSNGTQGTYSGTPDTLTGGTPYEDSNNDGIADAWASTHGISSASQVKSTYTIGGKTIINDAGYNALEIFLADLAGDFDRLPLDDGPGPAPSPNGTNNQKKAQAASNILNW